jgi:hypothetical protein
MRYFLVGYSQQNAKALGFANIGIGFPITEFPSRPLLEDTIRNNSKEGKELIDAGLNPKVNIQIVILGITELSEKDYNSFFEL